jgi:hypothetical protein
MKKTLSLLVLAGILCAPFAILAADADLPALPATGTSAVAADASATTPAVKKSIHKKSAKKGSKGKTAKKSAKHAKKAVKKSPATTTAPAPVVEKPAI